jgi:hypothetical protein
MASKPFYSVEEACQKLGKTADEIKALVRSGSLREFRDAGKVFYKAEDVQKLIAPRKAGKEDTGEILLEPVAEVPLDDREGSDVRPGLTPSSGGTSVIGLEPLANEGHGEKKEDTVITASGIGVFDEDELEIDTDPMAKTQITAGGTSDQVSLEGAGSGSGLLDLAREADDTALGADLLDEIYPGEEEAAEPAPAAAARAGPAPAEAPLEEVDAGEALMPVMAAGDPFEGLFGGLLVAGLVLMALACTVLAGMLQGFVPDFGRALGQGNGFLIFLGVTVVVAGIGAAAGWFVGKAFAPRRR